MASDHAYELMREALTSVLPVFETNVRTAKSSAAKKKLRTQLNQIKEVLDAAEQTSLQASDAALDGAELRGPRATPLQAEHDGSA